MTALYATRADVTKRMPIGSVTSQSGLVASSSVGADTFTLDGHGLEDGDRVRVRAIEGGALASPLVDGAAYFALRVSNSEFALSLTHGGPVIDITSASVSMVVSREPDFDSTIERYSRWADSILQANVRVPLETPLIGQFVLVRELVADLAAKRILNGIGKESAVVTAAEIEAKAQLERIREFPIQGTNNAQSTNLAISNTVAATGDPRGWGTARLP